MGIPKFFPQVSARKRLFFPSIKKLNVCVCVCARARTRSWRGAGGLSREIQEDLKRGKAESRETGKKLYT